MDQVDNRMYLCSKCFRRYLWMHLTPQEHRCPSCRLAIRGCAICDRRFEPRDISELHCKRCAFHYGQRETNTPTETMYLELDLDLETVPAPAPVPKPVPKPLPVADSRAVPAEKRSVTERWQQIKSANGIQDGYYY